MKRLVKSRLLILLVLVSLMMSVARCGYLMYPERRGVTSGPVDPVVLVLDCLWLLAGIVPGVVALLVDALAGGLYGSRAANVKGGDRIAFRLSGAAPAEANLKVIIRGQYGGQETVLLEENYEKGEESDKVKIMMIPRTLPEGDYVLTVSVNGVESQSWTLNLAH